MKAKLSNMNPDADGEYNLASIDLQMPRVTFSIKHVLSFILRRTMDINMTQVVNYNLTPEEMRNALKRFVSILGKATQDGRRNIIITIDSDKGRLELIGKRKEMDTIGKLFSEKLNR
jgi:hypothetical protein